MLHIAPTTTHKLSTYSVSLRTSINRCFTKLETDYNFLIFFLLKKLYNFMISASIFLMNGRGCKKKHDSLVLLNDALGRYIKFKKGFCFINF